MNQGKLEVVKQEMARVNVEPSSLLPPHTIPLGHPSAPAPSSGWGAHVYLWRIRFDVWQNSISLCPASFLIPRPNLPVTPGVS